MVERERGKDKVLCISNFTEQYMELKLDDRLADLNVVDSCSDILAGQRYMGVGKVIALDPYQTVLLQF